MKARGRYSVPGDGINSMAWLKVPGRPTNRFKPWMAGGGALCMVLSAGCGAPQAPEGPLGWDGPVEAREVRRWPAESLDQAPRWSMGEEPTFAVVPDSVRNQNWAGQQQILEATVFRDGKVLLFCNPGMGEDPALLHIFDPANGQEAKSPAPKQEDGRPWRWGHLGMAVHGDGIVITSERSRSEVSDVWFANRRGEFTRPRASINTDGRLLGAFPDGSLLVTDGWEGTATALVSRILSVRPAEVGEGYAAGDTRKVILRTATPRDSTRGGTTPLWGGHGPTWAVGVAGDTIWIVPTERPELVAVHRSGAVLLVVEWEAGDRTIPAEIGVVRRAFEREDGDSTVQYTAESWGRVEEGVVRPRAQRFPAARRLLIGTDGLIYVQRMRWADDRPRAGPEWLVFSPAGEWVARLEIPVTWEVLAFGEGSVVAQGRNDADQMEVRVHEVRKPE